MEIKILQDERSYNGWITGAVDDTHWFQAKLFDIGSSFGIKGGRVSKLCICKGVCFSWVGCIVNYDRGWDIKPKSKSDKDILKAVVEYLEKYPKVGG